MSDPAYPRERHRLADKLRELRCHLGAAVEPLDRRLPELSSRLGPCDRQRTVEDAAYHVTVLAAAIDSGSLRTFERHLGWVTEMMRARDVEPALVETFLDDVRRAVAPRLTLCEQELVDIFVDAGRIACRTSSPDPGPLVAADPRQQRYLDLIRNGDRRGALAHCLALLDGGLDAVSLCLDVIAWAEHRIGILWERCLLDVGEQHLATATTRWVTANLTGRFASLPSTRQARGPLVITCVPGERHDLAAQLLADLAALSGWDSRFLGAGVPLDDIVAMVGRTQATVLVVSVTMVQYLPQLLPLLTAVRARFGSSLRVLIGGAALEDSPCFWRDVGADAQVADLRAALATLAEWQV